MTEKNCDNRDIRATQETSKSNNLRPYQLPANYSPGDFPPVKMRERRHQNSHEQSETERKRRSKNRLSQRKSTGPISLEDVEEALTLDPYNNISLVVR